jgi:hypothetical protein
MDAVVAALDRPPASRVGRVLRFASESWLALLAGGVAVAGGLAAARAAAAGPAAAALPAGAVAVVAGVCARALLRGARRRSGL